MALAVVPSGSSSAGAVSSDVVSSSGAVRSAVVGLVATLSSLDVGALSSDECASLIGVLARAEKSMAYARASLAARAVDGGAHVRAGQPNPGEWLARVTGVSRDQARDELATAVAAGDVPSLAGALARGRLSMRQGQEIAATEAEVPGSAEGLVAQAEGSGLKWLKDECRRRREEAADPEVLLARQRRARRLRVWRDGLGMVRLAGALAPLEGLPLARRLQAEADRLFRATRRSGDTETTPEQLSADALVNLLGDVRESGGSRSKPATELVVVADIGSLVAGSVQPGGTCHVLGGGPIPVSEAIALAQDAFIKAVTHDGVQVQSIVHYGKRKKLPAVLASALTLGAPPLFHGLACGDRCGCELGLEIDHLDPLANGGPTSADNLVGRCSPSHKAKTARDRAAGLLGGRVSRRRSSPDEGRAPPDG